MINRELENRFTFHPVQPGQGDKYTAIREQAKELAYFLAETCPTSRELSTALTHLDSVVFFSNAAIARNPE